MSLLQMNSATTKKCCYKPKCLAKKEKKTVSYLKIKRMYKLVQIDPPPEKKSPKNHETNKGKTNYYN